MVSKLRLGYACVNEALKADGIRANRTLILNTIRTEGIEEAKRRALENVRDLTPILEWNEEHGIKLFRLGSELFPFASHTTVGYDLEFASSELRAVGDLAKRLGHRLTAHPGQYNNLTSKDAKIVDNSVRELAYHAQVFDLMGLDADSVMVLHGGGAYGDKPAALARLEANFARLPPAVARRLVLENDDKVYTVEDLLPVCERLEVPLVLDWHHDRCLPSSQPIEHYLEAIARTWTRRGIRQKQHQSESRDRQNPCAHSDYVEELPGLAVGTDVDLMIEAKMKEQAVLHLYRKYPWLVPDALWRRLDARRAWPEVNGFAYGSREGEEGDEDECERAERCVEKDEEAWERRRGARRTAAGEENGAREAEEEEAPLKRRRRGEEAEGEGRGRPRTRRPATRRRKAAEASEGEAGQEAEGAPPRKRARTAPARKRPSDSGEPTSSPAPRAKRARTVTPSTEARPTRKRGREADESPADPRSSSSGEE